MSVDEEIYSQGSRGISGVPGGMGLLNNIYGLVLARRSLFKIFCNDRFEQSKADPLVFFKFNDGQVEMVVVVHVDDILAHAQATMERFVAELEGKFRVKSTVEKFGVKKVSRTPAFSGMSTLY